MAACQLRRWPAVHSPPPRWCGPAFAICARPVFDLHDCLPPGGCGVACGARGEHESSGAADSYNRSLAFRAPFEWTGGVRPDARAWGDTPEYPDPGNARRLRAGPPTLA